MNRKLRIKILEKMAQANPAPAPTGQPAQSPTLPPPPAFQASAIYPGIRSGFNVASVPIIDNLINLLNTAVHYASGGKVNFQVFRNENFNFDASQSPSVDQKNLMNLSKKVYTTLLNNGNGFSQPLTGQQIADMTDRLLASQEYNNLSKVNPTGPLALKIPGNLKTNIYNNLTYLRLANPPR